VGQDYEEIKTTVLPEGLRRLSKVISIVVAVICFFVTVEMIRSDGWFYGVFIAVLAFFVSQRIIKTICWVKKGFNK